MKTATQPQVKIFKSGAYTLYARAGGWYFVKVMTPTSSIIDSVRCDDYRMARDYLRAFNAIARNY